MEEIWKNIKGFENYQVSNLGRVKDNNGTFKNYYVQNKGYCCLSLYKEGRTYHPTVHRVVAEAFLPNPNRYSQINHKDCNKENNCVSNLEWCNQKYNYVEGKKNFLYSHNESHYFAKLKNTDIPIIAKLLQLGFTKTTVAKIFGVVSDSIDAIIKGISYREMKVDFSKIHFIKYKDLPYIKLPQDIYNYLKDNTVLNTLIAQGKVSV